MCRSKVLGLGFQAVGFRLQGFGKAGEHRVQGFVSLQGDEIVTGIVRRRYGLCGNL